MGITILEFCHLLVERKKISRINGGMWSRLLAVGFGRDRNEMSSDVFVKIKLFVKITGSQPISI